MRHRLTSALAGGALILGSAGFLLAEAHDPVAQREAAMKTVGESAQTIGAMLKGEAPFDAEAANAALVAMQTATADFGTLFPEGTAGAGSNKWVATEAVWTDSAGFEEHVTKFQTDIAAAVDAAPQTLEALQPVFGAVGQNCRECHEDYRLTKE